MIQNLKLTRPHLFSFQIMRCLYGLINGTGSNATMQCDETDIFNPGQH